MVALGGNAILQPGQKGTFEEQLKNVEKTCAQIARLVADGFEPVITHGNGPQVGNILIQNEQASGAVPAMPLDACGAESQGLIGYMIQQSLDIMLRDSGNPRDVVTVVTRVEVDPDDPAFEHPTKPIGPFYSEDKARAAMRSGQHWVEDSGRGWRRVVPSPDPVHIVERSAIRVLLDAGVVVVASGGGGVPVVPRKSGGYAGVEAVIDKDLAAQRLAADVGAEMLVILTDVPRVAIHFKTPAERFLDRVTAEEARRYYGEGHFRPGSMGPKVKAAIRFVEASGGVAVISSLDEAVRAIYGDAGTWVVAS